MGVLTETRLSSAEAADLAGVSANTLRRWHKTGVDGVRLEGIFAGKKLVTSREALTRFLEKINVGRTSAA